MAANGQPDYAAREIARGLASAVEAAVESVRRPPSDVRTLTLNAAADVAELLDLSGLVALLAACEAHPDSQPLAVTHALERIVRLSREAVVRGDLSPFTQADRELAALAGTLSTQDWSRPGPGGRVPEPVQRLLELLADFELDDANAITNARVTLSVAAGLRAALEWIGADMGGGLRVTVHDAALTLAARAAHEPGLGPAGALLALSGGALLPEPDGRWALRVPLHSERPAFLLARQGALSLALPWHAVARLRIADDPARAVMTEPSLRPWSPLTRATGERPAALLALGLMRAWLHLDHIVWRVFAYPEPARASDVLPGGRTVVRTEEGGEYWVVDVNDALRGVPQLHTPAPSPRPRATAEPTLAPEPAHAPAAPAAGEALPAALPEAPPGSEEFEDVPSLEPVPSAPRLLGPEDVYPIQIAPPEPELAHHEAPSDEPAPESAREAARAPEPEPPPVTAAVHATAFEPSPASPVAETPEPEPLALRCALVVDDSLVARLTLGRVLERAGMIVEWVEHAGEMWEALEGSTWSVVFVDVSLPDATGRAHLRALVAHQLAAKRRFEVVALTRDAGEERLALESGITRTLRKPFNARALEDLVAALDAPPAEA